MPKKEIWINTYDRIKNGKLEKVSAHPKKINYKIGNPPNKEVHKSDYDKVEQRITADNIGFMQYEILNLIDWYGRKYGKVDKQVILDHFDDDPIEYIDDAIENCRSQGLLNGYEITPLGERVRKEFKEEWDD